MIGDSIARESENFTEKRSASIRRSAPDRGAERLCASKRCVPAIQLLQERQSQVTLSPHRPQKTNRILLLSSSFELDYLSWDLLSCMAVVPSAAAQACPAPWQLYRRRQLATKLSVEAEAKHAAELRAQAAEANGRQAEALKV